MSISNNETPGTPIDPEGMQHLLTAYLDHLSVTNYSPETISQRRRYLRHFITWAGDRGVVQPSAVTKSILESYQRHLFKHRNERTGKPLSFGSQRMHLSMIRGWFRWLSRQNHVLYNPAADLELPRGERRLPRHILSHNEAEQVLAQPDIKTAIGLRDRAILETFYSTGIRRRELANLDLYDIDHERRTVTIRQGKGRKDRMIPIGVRALQWIVKYITEARPEFIVDPKQRTLFLTILGQPLEPDSLTEYVHEYVKQANINKSGSCHLFRHTMATLMLENGADIRYIQEMLGHADISTTQIYTRVALKKLQEIHDATHPAKAARTERNDNDSSSG